MGFPGTLPKLSAALKRKGIALQEIGYLLVMHSHPDHAGLAQELKAQGLRLIVLGQQRAAIPLLKRHMKPAQHYVEITLHDNLELTTRESRAFLQRIGIAGEIVWTSGHTDDSVSLVLDEGLAFTGDLPPPGFVDKAACAAVQQSWGALRRLQVHTVYPGHAPARPMPSPAEQMRSDEKLIARRDVDTQSHTAPCLPLGSLGYVRQR